jgi:hypothetical protein
MSPTSIDGAMTGRENVKLMLPHGAALQPAIAGFNASVVVDGRNAGLGPVETIDPDGPLQFSVPLDGGLSVAVTVIPDGATPVATVGLTIVQVDGYSLPDGRADAMPGVRHVSDARAIANATVARVRRGEHPRLKRARIRRARVERLPATAMDPPDEAFE